VTVTLEELMTRVLETQKAYQAACEALAQRLKTEQTGSPAPRRAEKRLSEAVLEAMEPGKPLSLAEIGSLVGSPVDGRLRTTVSRLKIAKKLVRTGDGTYKRV
jgi:hypothetical protein